MKLRPIAFLLVIAAAFGLGSCGSKGNENSGDNSFQEAEESLKTEIKRVTDGFPDVTEIPYLLQATGADFNQGLLNDRKKADGYMAQSDKTAMNLGVYAADLAYLSSYEKTQECIDYLNSCKSLADNLGITDSFAKEIIAQFEANIGKRDTLASLLKDTMKKTDELLSGDQRSKLAALIGTASWVEGMYLATSIIKTYPKDVLPDASRLSVLTPLMQIVVKQRQSVTEIIKVLSSVDQSGVVPTVVADLKALESSYAALNIDDQIKNNKSQLVLSDKTLADITAKLEKIRADIVN